MLNGRAASSRAVRASSSAMSGPSSPAMAASQDQVVQLVQPVPDVAGIAVSQVGQVIGPAPPTPRLAWYNVQAMGRGNLEGSELAFPAPVAEQHAAVNQQSEAAAGHRQLTPSG